ncbi:DNA cytosine methyltransferase [Sphingomonas sp. CFBP 13733]|uniref:DNA cytosine methyltransferase n=1 Tax=Sphingomonas sp. CFBP 13733 TaxID=2775291 RepID=UPI00178670E5|nr:DNA cytosine methyltransferase [Sphingomonas sp. CFBP 13733]MBD8641628.1 DNA cytosine methyltransferase [Sphingomonas sp. CFBP 13733]
MQQSFQRVGHRITRKVRLDEVIHETAVADVADPELTDEAAFWQSVLRGSKAEERQDSRPLKVVDAFCGSGGLGLGVVLAAEAVGRRVDFAAIVDTDATAVHIHRHNLGARKHLATSVASLVDFHVVDTGGAATFGYDPEIVHTDLRRLGTVDMFIAGPPCQGHSNLNNHTRRQDPRNDLYVTAVALGVALGSEMILLENVPTVQNSHSDVVATAVGLLKSSGYGVSMAILKADELGAAQRRSRHFLLAVKGRQLDPDYLSKSSKRLFAPAMPLSWAIGDLLDRDAPGLLDTSPSLTPVNLARIDYLFDHDLYDLPDDQRPDCHKNGTTYTAVYGRLHWNRPSPTITTGFGTPGQGRYVHSLKRRVITPREASRIQGFPDWFDFAPDDLPLKRKNLAKWIGDAVHPILGYTAALSALAAVQEVSRIQLKNAA